MDHDFGVDLDFDKQVAGIRGKRSGTAAKSSAAAKQNAPKSAESTREKTEAPPAETEGFGVSHEREAPEGAQSTAAETDDERTHEQTHDNPDVPQADWGQFKTLPGLFEHVGGVRPVQFAPNGFKRSTVSNIPEPLLDKIQSDLRARYLGAEIDFAWGTYKVTEKHRVFVAKSSLVRYLAYDAMRDAAGTHVQYAKQWLALSHKEVFDSMFDIKTLKPTDDALDIYVLVYISHLDAMDSATFSGSVSLDEDSKEELAMMHMGISRMLDKMDRQSALIEKSNARHDVIQTVLVLDRMGLLKGGIPRDIEGFAGILERNRDILSDAGGRVDAHITAEAARMETKARYQRVQNNNQKNRG